MLKFMGLLPNSNALQKPAEDVASMIRLPIHWVRDPVTRVFQHV